MIKTIKRIVCLYAIKSLLALSITSCQQPKGGNNTDTNKSTEQTKLDDTTKPSEGSGTDIPQIPEKFKFIVGKSYI